LEQLREAKVRGKTNRGGKTCGVLFPQAARSTPTEKCRKKIHRKSKEINKKGIAKEEKGQRSQQIEFKVSGIEQIGNSR